MPKRHRSKSKRKTRRKVNPKTKRPGDGVLKHLDTAAEVAAYYGFAITPTPAITRDDSKRARAIVETETRSREGASPLRFSIEEKVAVMNLYDKKNMHGMPQPVLLYFEEPITTESAPKRRTGKDRQVELEIIGTDKSIAEAILIKTSFEILKEVGYENLSVHINSIGDRESLARFTRELTAYYRKNLNELQAHCRQLLKKDVFELLQCRNEKCRIMKESAPKSVSFLSEPSRTHFKEVLEYLETLDIPYDIDGFLVGNRLFCSQTLFEIHNQESAAACQPLATGVRWAGLAKKMGFKRDLVGIGAKLFFAQNASSGRKNHAVKKPKMYFIQLGFDAKLQSLKVIEMLRQAKIPLYQSLSRDKFISQLSQAETMKIPYTIIMGQKEAIENSVIVRDMATRSQETVPIGNLPDYLKRIK